MLGMLGSMSGILLPFLIPFLIASGYGLLLSNRSVLDAMHRALAVRTWAISLVVGVASIVGGLLAGGFAYGLSVVLSDLSSSGDLISELRFSTGFPFRVATFLVVTTLVVGGLSAIGGCVAWALLGTRCLDRSAIWWMRENVLLWGLAFMLSLVLAMLGGAYTRCIPPFLVLAVAGLSMGYSYGDYLRNEATRRAPASVGRKQQARSGL